VPDLASLITVQELDTSADQLRYRLGHLDEAAAVAALEAERDRVRRVIDAAAAAERQASARLAEIEAATTAGRTKRAKLETQLRSVVVVREAEALQREIARIDSEREAADEEGLALLDEVDASRATHASEQVRLADVEARLAASRHEHDRAVADVQERLAEVTRAREEAAASVDAGLRRRYEQLRHHTGGVAVARVVHGCCDGCHLELSAMELQQLKHLPPGEIAECGQCGRILVP
jgi:hypothetical protein